MDGEVGIEVEDEIGLVDAEDVAEDVVGTEVVDAAGGVVEVVFVVAVEGVVEGHAAGKCAGQGGRVWCSGGGYLGRHDRR